LLSPEDLQISFSRRASIIVQYGSDVMAILASAWSEPGEAPMSLAIELDRSCIINGFSPAIRYTVQRLQLGLKARRLQIEAEYTRDPALTARDAISSGIWGELPLWINKKYPEFNEAFIQYTVGSAAETDLGKQLACGEAIMVVVVCRGSGGDGQQHDEFVKCMSLIPMVQGHFRFMQNKKRHPNKDLQNNITVTKLSKFLFVEPTLTQEEGTIPSSSPYDHANMIRNSVGFIGDDDLYLRAYSNDDKKLVKIQHSSYAYLVV